MKLIGVELGVKPITNHRAIQINFNLFDGAGSQPFHQLPFNSTKPTTPFKKLNEIEEKEELLLAWWAGPFFLSFLHSAAINQCF